MSWKVSDSEPRSYEIRSVEPLLEGSALLSGGHVPGRRFVILDNGVPPRWRDLLRSYFERHRVEVQIMELRGGESCKEMPVVMQIIERLETFQLDRRGEPIIVIGGGAVLDVGGFAASIYRRGVPYIRVPTTLLGYVDASVGIKTAINFGSLKNLIGTFSEPYLVLLDTGLFDSLPTREISSGLGEILKLGFGCSTPLFRLLERQSNILEPRAFRTLGGRQMLHLAIEVMLRELRPNLRETDLWRVVDLGHTFSQAFEMVDNGNRLRHGEAVSLDVGISAVLAARRGLLPQADIARLARLTSRLGLPTTMPNVSSETLWCSVLERTRHRAGRQRIPLPRHLGECVFVDDVTADELAAAIDAFPRAFSQPTFSRV